MAAADACFFGDKFLAMECTLEAETSVSNLTRYKLFIGDDKKICFLEWPSPLSHFMLQKQGWALAWWATWFICRLYLPIIKYTPTCLADCLSVCLSTCLTSCLSTCILAYTYAPTHLPSCLHTYLPSVLPLCQSVLPSCLPFYWFTCIPACTYLPTFLHQPTHLATNLPLCLSSCILTYIPNNILVFAFTEYSSCTRWNTITVYKFTKETLLDYIDDGRRSLCWCSVQWEGSFDAQNVPSIHS